MSKEKQIEQMAKAIFQNCNCGIWFSEAEKIARFVVEEQGYRKQKEGAWKPIMQELGYCDTLKCSICGGVIDVSEGNYKFCPNCGAHMKGAQDV